MTDDIKIRAAEFVLGLYEAGKADLVDPEFQSEVSFWEKTFALFEETSWLEPVPSADEALWGEIEERLDELDTVPGTRTIPLEEGIWERIGDGIDRKVMHVDRAAHTQAFMVRMAKGAVLPSHAHDGDEHCVVVSGKLKIGGRTFSAGAYHFAARNTKHAPITAVSDAVFFIQGPL